MTDTLPRFRATSGPVEVTEVKGLLHVDQWWWIDTGITRAEFMLLPYGPNGTTAEPSKCTRRNELGRLYVAPGYLYDGTSRPIITAQGDVDLVPALVHDVFEEAYRAGKLTRSDMAAGDRLYRDLLRERGMSSVRSELRYVALRVRRFLHLDGRNKGPEYPRRAAR